MSPRISKWLGALGALAMLSSVGSALAAAGLTGEYYKIAPLSFDRPSRAQLFGCKTPDFTRVDPLINFHWAGSNPTDIDGNPPPVENFPGDGFATRWTGTLSIDAANAGSKKVIAWSDDGMRIWIKDVTAGPISGQDAPINDQWNNQGAANRVTANSTFNFEAGHKYYFLTEFFENGGDANAAVRWVEGDADQATIDAATDDNNIPEELFTTDFDFSGMGTTADTTPGAPGTLTTSDLTDTSVKLSFTAPGGDGATGLAGCYDVRYSITPFTADNFDKASQPAGNVYGLLVPATPGTAQTFTLTGLQPAETYFIGVRAKNLKGKSGAPTNIVTITTPSSAQIVGDGKGGAGTDGEDGAVVYLYSPVPQTNGDRLSQMFVPSLFKDAVVVDTINQLDAFADENGLNNEAWSMRYMFTLTFPEAGEWFLDNNTDDGGRVWFRDAPINLTNPGPPNAEDWSGHGPRETFTGPLTVEANKKYYVLFEWYESGGGAQAQLLIGQDTEGHTDKEILSTAPALNYKMQTYYIKATDYAQQGRIHGVVTLPDGTPVAGATVTAKAADNTTSSANTNALGGYSILLAAGSYTLTAGGSTPIGVRATGSAAAPATVTVGQILQDQNITLNPIDLPTSLVAPTDKVVYRDENQTTNWTGAALADRIRDYFVDKGFTEKNADDLQTWMEEHVTSKTPSVVLMANDIVPAQIVALTEDTPPQIAPNPLLRRYLDAGGRVVFPSDIPFYNISQDNANINFAQPGSTPVIGINASGGSWGGDADKPIITEAATLLGLTGGFAGNRGLREALPADVDVILARSPDNNADDWIKFFPDTNGTGAFIRVLDEDPAEGDPEDPATAWPLTDAMLDDILKLAVYGGPVKSLLTGGTVTPGCLGNVTDDNAVDVQDAVAILRHVVGIGDPLTGQKLTNANVNGDAGVDVQDAVIVLQAIVGIAPGNTIITSLTCP